MSLTYQAGRVTVNLRICMMATDNTLWMPGENAPCKNQAFYRVPGELGEYLVNAMVCKEHLKYLLKNGPAWVKTFREAKVPKGQNIVQLQELFRRQSVFSELL